MSDNLPKGWAKSQLSEIAEINPRHPRTVPDDTVVSFAPMSALREDSRDFDVLQERSLGSVRKGFTHFADGDVLFAKITPCMENGKGAAARNLRNGLGCGTTELHVIRPLGGIVTEYVYYFTHQQTFRRDAERNFTGSAGQARVPTSFIEQAEIPLAPIAEQRRVVRKLQGLLAKVHACRKRLDRIPKLLKRFRQAVLSAACSGRLTADWREDNPYGGSVTATVGEIRRRREGAAGTDAELRRIKNVYAFEETNASDELPISWRFTRLAKVCESLRYGTSVRSEPTGKVPVLRMGNVQSGSLDWTELVYTSDNKEIRKYSLSPGTVLFNRTNSPELVGKTAIYRGERIAAFAGYLIGIKTVPELNPEYLNHCLNTTYAREFCLAVKTDGVSQSNINAEKLGAFEVPLCPIDEQLEIVRRVGALFALADQIEARYQKARAHVEKITQSILAKAFRGELVPQVPKDESAEKLLERIRQERNANGDSRRRTRRAAAGDSGQSV